MIRPEAFVFHNGRSARSAQDLLTILEEGPESLYHDHVNTERNDFANWARHSLQEEALAQRLAQATNRDETLATLHDWLEPHRQRAGKGMKSARTDFFLGLTVGLIIGILVMAVLRMVA